MSQSKIFWMSFIKILVLLTCITLMMDSEILSDSKQTILLMILINSGIAFIIAFPFSFFKKNKNINPQTWDTVSDNPEKTLGRFLFHFVLNCVVCLTIAVFLLQLSDATQAVLMMSIGAIVIICFLDAWLRFYKSGYRD